MLSQDSKDEIWSRFVFELVIWPKQIFKWIPGKNDKSKNICKMYIFKKVSGWKSLELDEKIYVKYEFSKKCLVENL